MKHLTLVALALVPAGLVARPSFDLPDTLYAAPGLECNVYFASSFDSVRPDRFAFEARGNVGKCESARWTWTPKKEDAGKREQVVFNAWTDEGLLTAKTVTVEVAKAPSDTSRKVTCALLADSLTNARYQDRILAVLREKGWANYTPVGSRSGTSAEAWGVYRDGEAAHDGYGGYTTERFFGLPADAEMVVVCRCFDVTAEDGFTITYVETVGGCRNLQQMSESDLRNDEMTYPVGGEMLKVNYVKWDKTKSAFVPGGTETARMIDDGTTTIGNGEWYAVPPMGEVACGTITVQGTANVIVSDLAVFEVDKFVVEAGATLNGGDGTGRVARSQERTRRQF